MHAMKANAEYERDSFERREEHEEGGRRDSSEGSGRVLKEGRRRDSR